MSHGASVCCWPRLYTDASIIRSLASLDGSFSSSRAAIARLDRAIIVAGAAGEGRLDLILTLIRRIQTEFLSYTRDSFRTFSSRQMGDMLRLPPSNIPLKSSLHRIPALDPPPSFMAFQTTFNRSPLVLYKYASSWPAINEHPWSSASYLRFIAGPARMVPVEVGADYRADDWTQQLMNWDDFLSTLELNDYDLPTNLATPTAIGSKKVLYLAQHNLFMQFPDLRRDIVIPDYVYSCPQPPSDYPQYKPPGNDEQLVINGWLGPRGTISPAHTDPYFNIYVQIVGRKTIWLAPPYVSEYMYAFDKNDVQAHDSSNPASNKANPLTSNTSRVDVFTTVKDDDSPRRFPAFWTNVVPHAISTTLEPGDLLFIPPGWWHAMRADETSFSVSMWF
ncbi:Clavaminate synthase-like protein [Lentinula aciculospora]|uniref:Clavaminate synthase-like protein n=1 Tax=Lentinula aciculospora TaxID=153920 RepID=A0A9W9DW04_9AGAR|nr:Clavaminate synthase-like protein [Lentinula aciculospora]